MTLIFNIGSITPISEGGGEGSSDYPDLTNKPKVNGNTLVGNKTNIDLDISTIIDVGSGQTTYKTYVIPQITKEDAIAAYDYYTSGTNTALKWSLYGNDTYLNIISTDEIAGTYSIDVCLHNQFHISYKWSDETETYCEYEVTEGGLEPVLVEVGSTEVLDGHTIPSLTGDQVVQIFNGIVAGKQVVVTSAHGAEHYVVNSAYTNHEDKSFITLNFQDIMTIRYDFDGNATAYHTVETWTFTLDNSTTVTKKVTVVR